jgi:hypothetical protein
MIIRFYNVLGFNLIHAYPRVRGTSLPAQVLFGQNNAVKVVDMANGSLIDLIPYSSDFDQDWFKTSDDLKIMVNPSGLTCYNEHGVSSLHPHPLSEASVIKLPLRANTPSVSHVFADISTKTFAAIGYSPRTCSTGKFEVLLERPSSILPLVGEDLCQGIEKVDVIRINSKNQIYSYLLGDVLSSPINVPVVSGSASFVIMVSEKCDFVCLIIVQYATILGS